MPFLPIVLVDKQKEASLYVFTKESLKLNALHALLQTDFSFALL